MFKNPFSFEGRIRRTEYGVSFIIYAVIAVIINAIMASSRDAGIFGLAYIPMLWFLWAQGAKRCHDVGNSGWWQLIPFYALWLLFQDGQAGSNQYGDNPKGIGNNQQSFQNNQSQNYNPQNGYQGGYSGGHNNPNTNYSSTQNSTNTDGYNNGDLYK
jgi:uncharacterized membrane protein YhaH (DUF805 family)